MEIFGDIPKAISDDGDGHFKGAQAKAGRASVHCAAQEQRASGDQTKSGKCFEGKAEYRESNSQQAQI